MMVVSLEEYTEKHAPEMIKRLVELLAYQNSIEIKYTIKKCTDQENGTHVIFKKINYKLIIIQNYD